MNSKKRFERLEEANKILAKDLRLQREGLTQVAAAMDGLIRNLRDELTRFLESK